MSSQKTILTAGPSITRREIAYVLDAVEHGWNEDWNLYIRRFEDAFAERVGVSHALSTSSCTGALHLALKALEIGPGHEVLVPESTWVATASAVTYVGATPVMVDVEPDTWCMDPNLAEQAITPRTRAMIPVHLYGQPANMNKLVPLARSRGLAIIEDAAPALGATISTPEGEQPVGSLGDIACFSFQGAKIMTTGEGGMAVTSSKTLFERMKFYNEHGRAPGGSGFQIAEVGFKYKMSNIQAALGLGQLERLDELVGKKRQILAWYKERLGGVKGLQLNPQTSWSHGIAWMSSVVLDPKRHAPRLEVTRRLKAAGIDTRPFFPPLSSFPMFGGNASFSKVATHLGDHGINLPSGHNLTESDVDCVADGLRAALRPIVRSVA